MNATIQKAIQIAIDIANNDYYGYAQDNRWGQDGDCSSWNIRIWELAGVPVRSYGATYTRNMKVAYIAAGFTDVTRFVNFATGEGLEPADVLLNTERHAALYLGDYNGKARQIFQAAGNEKGGITGGQPGDQTGKEVYIRDYYNSPWDVILRYTKEDEIMNPYQEPTKSYKKDEYFTGNDAYWFQWMLREIGHLIELDGKAGAITWEALNWEIAQSGNPGGDADEKVRSYMKAYIGMVNPADEIAVLKKQVEDLKARLESIYILAKL